METMLFRAARQPRNAAHLRSWKTDRRDRRGEMGSENEVAFASPKGKCTLGFLSCQSARAETRGSGEWRGGKREKASSLEYLPAGPRYPMAGV